jgi:molybdenum cofactor sulfurtransferase
MFVLKLNILTLDPIKSCHAYSIPKGMKWPLTSHGLAFDREFFLISRTGGRALSQKQYPRMALIRPNLSLETRTMSVSSPASPDWLQIPLDVDVASGINDGSLLLREKARVCADSIRSLVFTCPRIQNFFSAIVGVECSLAMYHPEMNGNMRYFKPHLSQGAPRCDDTRSAKREIWLSNESPYLLISESSVNQLSLASGKKEAISPSVFRPNFLLTGNGAYSEDLYKKIMIGSVRFDVLGQCRRCHMVCVDPEKGVKEKEGGDVYLGLGKTRKKDNGVVFGVHMALTDSTDGFVKVGDPVVVEERNAMDTTK